MEISEMILTVAIGAVGGACGAGIVVWIKGLRRRYQQSREIKKLKSVD